VKFAGISLYNLQAKVSLACFSQFFVGSTSVYYIIHMSKENLHTAAESTGTWRTYIAKEESAWCLVAKDVPEKYAATVSVNPCTALRMLQDIVDLKPGASVVQNGATSMVGQCVIQLARLNDLQTINLIRDRPDLDSVKERLKALGADYVLTEEELGSLDKKTLAGRAQAKLGLNCVGGSAATAVMKLLG
jgi:trans-2-enoyl-CoA reductase